MEAYEVSLKNQLSFIKDMNIKNVYLSIKKDKRIRNGDRDVIVINPSSKPNNGVMCKLNENLSFEIPKSLIRLITHDEDDNLKYSMLSSIDDKGQKILVPWFDEKGNF